MCRAWARPLFAAILLPGLGSSPGAIRVPVSIAAPPWSALVRVQVPGVARCTGFLVSRDRVVTAAHCLWSQRVLRMAPAESVHVLTGYDHGSYRAHTIASALRVGLSFGPGHGSGGADIAVLTLAAPIGTVTLPWATQVRPGQAAMLGGYEQDRAETLMADTDCRVLGGGEDTGGRAMLAHSCAATLGASGAPLLVRNDHGDWAVAGVEVAATEGDAGGFAVPASIARALVEESRK